MRRSIAVCLLLGAGASLPGCSRGVHGVQVHNQTDRLVRVELIQLNRAGEMSVYSTQTLTAGGEFQNKVDADERHPGMRIRFSLIDQSAGGGGGGGGATSPGAVLLNLPDNRDREYDLVLVGDRLSAKELSKQSAKPRR